MKRSSGRGPSSTRSRRSGETRSLSPTAPASGGRRQPKRCWRARNGSGDGHDPTSHRRHVACGGPMTTTLWDTTGTDLVHALIAERRSSGAVASGLALSLVVVVDEKRVPEAEEAATIAAAAHPCRLLIVVRRKLEGDDRLDAEVSIGGRLGPTEAIVMRMHGRLTLHAESVVLPLLAPDAPVVTWWVGTPPDQIAHDPLGVLADRRITDVAAAADPLAALRVRAADYAPGDTDLAWTRATGWRALLASAFDAL